MNNFKKIKNRLINMGIKDMAKFLSFHIGCYMFCNNRQMYAKGCKCGKENCIKYIEQWLLKEVEDE